MNYEDEPQKRYFLTYDDFAGNHGRDPQTFIVNGPNKERWFFRTDYYGYAYRAELAARRFMKSLNDQPPAPPVLPPETLRWSIDDLLGEAGKRP